MCCSRPRGFPMYASIAQLAEHLLRKEKVTSSILVGGWATGSHGLVGYDARLTRERSRVRASVRIKCLSFCFCFILSASFIDKKKHTQKEKANIGCTMIYGLFCGPGGRKKCVQTYDTQDSRMVPHCSTNWAQQCLTSQFGWDAVSSLWCDRKTLTCVLDLYSTWKTCALMFGGKKCAQTYDTQDSRMVPHCSTNQAQQCLTSQFGWDAVSSLWCDRKTLTCVSSWYPT